ncbi:hypothetical protein C8J57DRAFT_1713496 [Mycena rebaudengoi]|nr:hypothetical protein C8J57DRAFT_1713496 [Mycena rebaudengoi]
MSAPADVRATLGAILAGCIAAIGLSAVLGFQCFLYFRIFPADSMKYKLLVAWIWITDAVHSALICTGVWQYTIDNFERPGIVDKIFPVIAYTVAVTALTTFSVNMFYVWRIHKLNKRNWPLSALIVLLSVARVGLAFTTTTELLLSKTFSYFAPRFKILFTSGLFVSAVTDVIVSAARYQNLRSLRQGYSQNHEAVDAVLIFTINDGCLTCAVVIISIAFWLTMPHNFVYLGIYFTIAKLYSNSVLATLNLRNWYRHRNIRPQPVGIPMNRATMYPNGTSMAGANPAVTTTHKQDQLGDPIVEVFVDHQVEYNVGSFNVRENHDRDKDAWSRKSMNVA